VESIAVAAVQEEAALVIVDAAITPIQQRNLETATKAKVIDRTGLDPRDFRRACGDREGRCRSNWRISIIRPAGSSGPGPTSSGSAAAFGFLGGPAKRRSRPTAG
jgi:GTP-binding protein HflX